MVVQNFCSYLHICYSSTWGWVCISVARLLPQGEWWGPTKTPVNRRWGANRRPESAQEQEWQTDDLWTLDENQNSALWKHAEMRRRGTRANLVGKSDYHGTDKKPEGLSSKGEISILIWRLIFLFFEKSFDGHLCLFVLTFCFLKGRRADFWHKLVWVKWEKEDLPQTVPHCAVLTSTSVSNRGGGGLTIKEELSSCPWNRDILLCPRSTMSCPSVYPQHVRKPPKVQVEIEGEK